MTFIVNKKCSVCRKVVSFNLEELRCCLRKTCPDCVLDKIRCPKCIVFLHDRKKKKRRGSMNLTLTRQNAFRGNIGGKYFSSSVVLPQTPDCIIIEDESEVIPPVPKPRKSLLKKNSRNTPLQSAKVILNLDVEEGGKADGLEKTPKPDQKCERSWIDLGMASQSILYEQFLYLVYAFINRKKSSSGESSQKLIVSAPKPENQSPKKGKIDINNNDDCIILADKGNDKVPPVPKPRASKLKKNSRVSLPQESAKMTLNLDHGKGEKKTAERAQKSELHESMDGDIFLYEQLLELVHVLIRCKESSENLAVPSSKLEEQVS